MKYKRLNIIFIPDKNFQEHSFGLAKLVGESGRTTFRIDNKKYFAHITIYSPEFPEENISEVIKKVRDLSIGFKKFKLPIAGLDARDGFVAVKFKKTITIAKIHRTIVQKLNPFRRGRIRQKYAAEIKKRKRRNEEVRMIKRYGYPYVLKLYRPHLSLARLVSQESAAAVIRKVNIPSSLRIAKIVKIGIAEPGQNGTCANIIQEYKLK
jgi:2'-5' RNA ligase